MKRARVAIAMLTGVLCLPATGCWEERVVYRRPPLAGLPGAQANGVVTPDRGVPMHEALVVPEGRIRVEDPVNEETILYAKTGRHLFSHILKTLQDDERELFVEQVLSEETRQQAYQAGRDPSEAFDMLEPRLDDIRALFSRMPAGELQANVTFKKLTDRRWRVTVPRMQWPDLRFVGLEMVWERSNWRLGWFVTAREVRAAEGR